MSSILTLADGVVIDLSHYPLPEGVDDDVPLNRTQLGRAFSVSENTITKWVALGMPVISAGQNGVAYEFRLSHCWAWKSWRDGETRATKERGDLVAQQASLRFRNRDDEDEEADRPMTAAEVRAEAEADYHRNRAAEQRGELMRTARVRVAIEDIIVAFGTAMDTLPDWAEMEFGLTPDQVQQLQDKADAIRQEARMLCERQVGARGVVAFDSPQGQMAI
ncbi:MAG: terminase small subunit [bacterium]|nr:terminase small subunit [bacterium]